MNGLIDEHDMTLALDWNRQDVAGWFCSEKLDGCRAYWDGEFFWTRGGNIVKAPAWFTAGLPACHLDGELWAGRGAFQAARAATCYGRFTEHCRFMIFDRPQATGPWNERMAGVPAGRYFEPVQFRPVANERDLLAEFRRVADIGGEGIMLRNPAIEIYEKFRTGNLLRLKTKGVK